MMPRNMEDYRLLDEVPDPEDTEEEDEYQCPECGVVYYGKRGKYCDYCKSYMGNE